MRRQRSAKIVATLGPASSSLERIRALFDAGSMSSGCNFSHGTHDDHRALFAAIRRVESETGRPIGILADMQGPKLRLGNFAGGKISLAAGDKFRLDLAKRGGRPPPRAAAASRRCSRRSQPGTELLVDDGKVRLKVTDCGKDFAETECLVGGALSDHKGVNVPHVRAADLGGDRQGPRRSRRSHWSTAPTGSRCPSCSGPRMSPRGASWSATRPG